MYSLGIDVGTSGIRAVVMDINHCILVEAQKKLPQSQPCYAVSASQEKYITGYSQNPVDWWNTLESVIFLIAEELEQLHKISLNSISHLALDGTSGTVLLCNQSGTPISEALMYNDQRAITQAAQIAVYAPENTAAIGPTSGLAKILWLYTNQNQENQAKTHYALNQSDWLCGQLLGKQGYSDHNNALKMGYDAQDLCWPQWLDDLLKQFDFPNSLLPEVYPPGQVIGTISSLMASHFGFNHTLKICAGTTDSTAAIIAAGAKQVGDAVTSLGSTLVMKIVSEQAIFDPKTGVYSQPYGHLWLVGGGSNSGGEVLKQFYDSNQLSELTEQLNLKIDNNCFSMLDLNFYPLSAPGERFPIQDPTFKAKLSPRPDNEGDFFQALLEGMSDIESLAYQKLVDLGAPYPKLVKSIGGGALNKGWRYIREQKIGVPVKLADQDQAAAGTALLAQSTWHQSLPQ